MYNAILRYKKIVFFFIYLFQFGSISKLLASQTVQRCLQFSKKLKIIVYSIYRIILCMCDNIINSSWSLDNGTRFLGTCCFFQKNQKTRKLRYTMQALGIFYFILFQAQYIAIQRLLQNTEASIVMLIRVYSVTSSCTIFSILIFEKILPEFKVDILLDFLISNIYLYKFE